MKSFRPQLAIVFLVGIALLLVSLIVPAIRIDRSGIDGVGWFVLGMQAYLRHPQHQSQVFVVGFMVASIALILWIVYPRLSRVLAKSS